MKKIYFVYNPEQDKIPWPEHIPFRPERTALTRKILTDMQLFVAPGVEELAAPPASREDLLAFHTAEYLRILEQADAGRFDPAWLWAGLGGDDTPVFPGIFLFSTLACGATLQGARLLLEGQADIAVNLTGGFHHARADHAAGFCYLNDVVLACQMLAQKGRVVYLDIDAHQADGVQEAFYQSDRVFTLSVHESGETLYPGTGWEEEIGSGAGEGYNLNLPLPAGCYDGAFLRGIEEVCLPLIDAYRPDFIVLQCGMDGLHGDPLAHLKLTNESQATVVRRLLERNRPLLVTGGGGYHVQNTARGWARVWLVLTAQEQVEDYSLGMGGVMLESTEHAGGLRDRQLHPSPSERQAVDARLTASLEKLKKLLFPRHGL